MDDRFETETSELVLARESQSAFSAALTPTFILLDPAASPKVSSRSPAVISFLDYWTSRCPQRDGRISGIPRRADIEPWHITDLLPNVMLTDLSYDPFRVCYRLVGTHIVRECGHEFTGRYLDQLTFPDVVRTRYMSQYAEIAATRQPGLGVTFLSDRLDDDDIYWIERHMSAFG